MLWEPSAPTDKHSLETPPRARGKPEPLGMGSQWVYAPTPYSSGGRWSLHASRHPGGMEAPLSVLLTVWH